MFDDLELGGQEPTVENLFSYPSPPRTTKDKEDFSRSQRVHWIDEKTQRANVEALRRRAYHLPSNKTWCEDWRQFMANNHPLWGLCCFDKKSPIGWGHRLLGPLVSIFVGYSFTIITLWLSVTFLPELDEPIVSMSISSAEVYVTWTQVFLWTWIGCVHAFHDVAIWRLFYSTVGGSLLWLFVWVGIALSFTGVMVGENASSTLPSDELYGAVDMAWYAAVEIACSWLLWYLLVGTIMFSGVLGCGRTSFLGGRPHELYLKKQKKNQESKITNRDRLKSRSLDSAEMADIFELSTVRTPVGDEAPGSHSIGGYNARNTTQARLAPMLRTPSESQASDDNDNDDEAFARLNNK